MNAPRKRTTWREKYRALSDLSATIQHARGNHEAAISQLMIGKRVDEILLEQEVERRVRERLKDQD